MALNVNRYKRKKVEASSKSSGDFWYPRAGTSKFRVYTFEHKVTKFDFDIGRYQEQDAEIGDVVEEIDVYQPVHFIKGRPVNCEGKDCQYCEDAKKTGDKDVKARDRYYINIVLIDEPTGQVKVPCLVLGSVTKTVYDEILSYVLDDDYGQDILGPTGRDFTVDYDPKAQGSKMYTVRLRDAKKCEDLSDEDFEAIDIMNLEQLFPGNAEAPPKEEPEDKTDKKKQKKKVTEEEEEEQTEKAPSSVKKSSKKEDQFEIGDDLCFDDKKLGTIEGELISIEEDKKNKRQVFIIKDEDGTEFEAYEHELYRKEKEEKKSRVRRSR